MGCFLDADRPGVVLPALRHWPPQLRVPLALPELLVQQALRVWVLPLPVLPELAEQQLGQVPQRALPSQALGQGLEQALERRPPGLALPFWLLPSWREPSWREPQPGRPGRRLAAFERLELRSLRRLTLRTHRVLAVSQQLSCYQSRALSRLHIRGPWPLFSVLARARARTLFVPIRVHSW